jgi:hypothetical protein
MKLERIKQYIPDLLAVLLLIALPPLVFWQVWAPHASDRVMFGGDILMGAYPTRVFVHRLFELGAIPLWNPYQLAGMPLLGDVQVAPYYLPNLLLDLLYRGRDLSYQAFEMLVVAHYALGALFLYAYVRRLGVHPAAALIGAIGFQFNGFFVGHRGHYNMLAVVVWLPGVLWLLDCAWHAERPRRALAWAVAAGLALSQMVMAGHPQATLYCALMILGYFGYRWAGALRRPAAPGWRARLWLPALFGLAGILAAGIAAVALLPAAELLSRSLRNDPSYTFASQYSLLPRNFVGLLMPEFLNWSGTEFRIYAGILTLVLAAAAWLLPDRGRPEQRFFGAAAVVALITALGGFTVLHGLIYRFVPGFGSIRVSVRAFYVANLSLSVLAALGAEQLLGELGERELLRLRTLARGAGLLLAGAAVLGAGLYVFLMTNFKPVGEDFFFAENLFSHAPAGDAYELLTQTANAYLVFVLLLAGATALLWARLNERVSAPALALAAGLLMFLDVATFAPYHDTIKADPQTARFAIKNYATTILDAQWKATDQQQLIDRLSRLPDGLRADNTAEVLPDNYSAVYQTPFASGYNILDLQSRFELLTQWPNLSPATRYELLNVGYILLPADAKDPPEPDAQLVEKNSQGQLWKRAQQPSYAHFSTAIRPVDTSIAINSLLKRAGQPIDAQPVVATDGGQLRAALKQLWPDAIDPALYQIGKTGARSPVDISVLAGGPVKYSAVIVGGVSATPKQRGIVLAEIDPQTGKVLHADGFDTFLSSDESDRLAATIGAAPEGAIVALATYDEGFSKLNDAARAAIASLGTSADLHDKIGFAYAVIGVKGSASGTAVEQLDKQTVVIDVGSGALAAQPGASFSSRLVTYRPDRITLLVRNSARGLLSISEAAFPGWEAYVDGVPTPILRANGLQRAVILPPLADGAPHEVTFAYRPLSARLGGAISLITLALAIGLLLALAALAVPWPRALPMPAPPASPAGSAREPFAAFKRPAS